MYNKQTLSLQPARMAFLLLSLLNYGLVAEMRLLGYYNIECLRFVNILLFAE